MRWRLTKESKGEKKSLIEIVDYLGNNLFTYRAFIPLPFSLEMDKERVREEFREKQWNFTEGCQAYKVGIYLEELVGSILFIRCYHEQIKSIGGSELKNRSLLIPRVFALIDDKFSETTQILVSIKTIKDLKSFLKDQGFKAKRKKVSV